MVSNSGMIKDMAMPWLSQALLTSKKTGTLICGLDKTVKKIYLSAGEIVFASSSLIEDRLGECMVRIGAITPDQRDTSLSASFQQRKKLGTVLVETGLITPKQLVAGVKHQVWQITSSIFNMFGGCYIFDESPLPDIIPIRLDTVKLIFDSIQKIEWDVVRRSFPVSTLKSVINAVDISTCIFAEKLEKDQQVILSLADGTKSIEVLCNTSKLGDYNALKAVYVLLALKRATVCDPNMPATQKT